MPRFARVSYKCNQCGKVASLQEVLDAGTAWGRIRFGGVRETVKTIPTDVRYVCSASCARRALINMSNNLLRNDPEAK